MRSSTFNSGCKAPPCASAANWRQHVNSLKQGRCRTAGLSLSLEALKARLQEAATAMSAAVPSASGSPASSVDSAELQSLLLELDVLPAAAVARLQQQQRAQQQGGAKRRFLLDSDSDGVCSPSSSRPQASPRLDESGSRVATAALLPLPQHQQLQHQQQQRGRAPSASVTEPDVIDILDSSSDEDEEIEEEWCISAPATSQKQRCGCWVWAGHVFGLLCLL